MISKTLIGSYVLDSLQIYFAWDDDLYTHLKERGLGQSGLMCKKLPLIYSDNCESTTGIPERSRKYVISPDLFGETYTNLGWTQTSKVTEPIIPSEKPEVSISLIDNNYLEFRINPRPRGREEYHLEYSAMSAFGRLYTNWGIIILTINDFRDLLTRLKSILSFTPPEPLDIPIYEEKKQAQRERILFVQVPIHSYKFSLGEFLYAKRFMELNGVSEVLPSLVFQDESSYREYMEPILKVGFVHTTGENGFERRKPQCTLKVAQPKITITKRGKRGKMKGRIITSELYENWLIVPAKEFLLHSTALNKFIYNR